MKKVMLSLGIGLAVAAVMALIWKFAGNPSWFAEACKAGGFFASGYYIADCKEK